ncbi:MAG: winged helix-turn-helix domain-containing protein [Planctomycetota bacterium]
MLDALRAAGFEVEVAISVADARRGVPIVILTARDAPEERVRGLDVGSDDYVVKPFHMPELLARIRSVLRRAGRTVGPGVAQAGDLWADPESRKARCGDRMLELTPREFDLLIFLLRHPGRAWTRDQLLDRVWGPTYEGESRTVDSHIRRLRSYIEADSGDPRYIGTVWGVGYRMNEVPGTFPATGRDEIALLSRSMNSMRERVLGLLAGMEQRESERREWVAQVSHDLRTPLTALLACLDHSGVCLQETNPEQLKRDLAELFAVAKMDALRVQALADDLLEIARLEAGSGLDLEPVPPGELVRQTVRALSPLAEVRGVELKAEIAPGLPTVQADGRRLMRAVENLLKNAVHHATRSVQVRASHAGGRLLLEVRDDGPGLPEENGAVILNRLPGLRSRRDSAGLGLVVAERVARAHGGRIGARFLPGGGAAVWLELPAREGGEADP